MTASMLASSEVPSLSEQRSSPSRLSDRAIAEHYTLQPDERAAIAKRRRDENRLGFAVQLAVLRFPGHTGTIWDTAWLQHMHQPAPYVKHIK